MVRRIILGLMLVGLIALIYVGYKDWSARRAMLSGDVTVGPGEPLPVGSPTPPAPHPSPTEAQPQTQAQPEPQGKPSPAPVSDSPAAASNVNTVPTTDSQPPDAPNGARFAGTGRYEVYRQGNLTYRIDTGSGRSCVLFATKEEWRKREVYRHGCGSSAAQ